MRYASEQPGIRSRHEFSAGAHYDASNVSFGPVIGLDEHVLDPGAGFVWHAHSGVHIVSLVLEGTLRHADVSGQRLVRSGVLLVQSAARGYRHAETNASDSESLRFVQITVLDELIAESAVRVASLPAVVGAARVAVVDGDILVDVAGRVLVVDLR